ncbi:MAG: glycosyltransferase, partial [Burkholderiaceae bacterium]
MKILHITTGLENGGAEAILYRLVSRDKGDNTHEVVSLMDAGFYGTRILQSGTKVHTLQMPRGRLTLTGLIKLHRLISSVNPDVIQTWMYHADLIGGAMALLSGKRAVVWGIHNSNLDIAKTLRSTRFVAHLCAWTSHFIPTKIICCSEQAAQAHIALGYRADKMIVVHNGIEVDEFMPDGEARDRLRAEWCIGENEVLLGMVARWDLQKDHKNLFAAAGKLISRTHLAWRCVLVGPEMVETNHEAVALLREHGMRDYFRLAGPSSDIPAVMNAFDLHVLP